MGRLAEKWGVTPWRVVVICIVFSLTGMTVVYAKKWVFALFGFDADTAMWIKVSVYILTIFPLYQFFLIVYGTLFGEFKFFWAKEKKMLQFFGRAFRKKKSA
jgi:hypothetical protein